MKRKVEHILLERIKESVRLLDPEAEIILFGSRARGESKEESDWDILILLSEKLKKKTEKKIRDTIFEIELETEQPISTLIYSKAEWDDLEVTPLYQNVKSEGMLL